jgi:hypothetical protein
MKNFFVLLAVLLGTSLLATNTNSYRFRTMNRESRNGSGPVGAISIIIDKSDYELSVYDDKGWYATYPVVFSYYC